MPPAGSRTSEPEGSRTKSVNDFEIGQFPVLEVRAAEVSVTGNRKVRALKTRFY